jgi:hypothetical protein
MNKYNASEIFKTSDLPLAATLYLYKPIEFIDKSDSQRVVFAFVRSEEIDRFIEQFWKNELKVNPRFFFESLKSIKSLIRQQ